jgi:hypothetical protein
MERVRKHYPKNHIGYVVGHISTVLAGLLLSETQVVILSEASLEKNLNNHPDLVPEDYLKLGEIIGKSHFACQDGKRTIGIAIECGTLYHYALKSTQTGEAVFLTSFRKTGMQDVTRLRNKAKKGKANILKDILP